MTRSTAATTSGETLSPELEAVLRWQLGHQVFHLQLVTMNSLIDTAQGHLKAQRYGRFRQSIHRLCRLFEASTATMAYASDFEKHWYDQVIRPSMAPPWVSPGFSGLLNQDHTVMLKQVKALRARLKQQLGKKRALWPKPVLAALDELTQAIQRNRDNHGLICQEFVPGGKSLLKDFYRQQRSQKKSKGSRSSGATCPFH